VSPDIADFSSAALPVQRPRFVLMCQADSSLNRVAVARWLCSFADLVGIVLIDERGSYLWRRLRYEYKRVGLLRLVDVFAFKIFYALGPGRHDRDALARRIADVAAAFPPVPATARILVTNDPNSLETARFVRDLAPDMMLARCKHILRPSVFEAPMLGTYVLHPGICPEYRNAHGAFWALANDELDKVGLTLLRVDRGVDTGPVYDYFHCSFDEIADSHIVIMTELLLQNLLAIQDNLLAIWSGAAATIDTAGRRSGAWGQPWLTSYLRWKRMARRRRNENPVA